MWWDMWEDKMGSPSSHTLHSNSDSQNHSDDYKCNQVQVPVEDCQVDKSDMKGRKGRKGRKAHYLVYKSEG